MSGPTGEENTQYWAKLQEIAKNRSNANRGGKYARACLLNMVSRRTTNRRSRLGLVLMAAGAVAAAGVAGAAVGAAAAARSERAVSERRPCAPPVLMNSCHA